MLYATTRKQYREWGYIVSFEDAVSLTLVSYYNWRDKILLFPQFWRDIVVSYGREDSYMKLGIEMTLGVGNPYVQLVYPSIA